MSTSKAPKHCYWRGDTLWARLKIGGVERRESLKTSDTREAMKRLRDLKIRLERERIAGPKPKKQAGHSWQEAVQKWEAEVLPGAVKPAVAKRYKVSAKQLAPTFGKLTIEAITAKDIAAYLSSRAGKATNATLKRDLTALSRLLAATISWGWRLDNPAKAYDRTMIREWREPIHPPSLDDIETMIQHAPNNMGRILRLLAETGMRTSEAVRLQRFQVDPTRKQLTLTRTKTNRSRTISWRTPGGDASSVLDAMDGTGYLFPAEPNVDTPYCNFPSNARQLTRLVIKKCSEEQKPFRSFRVHDLRHAFAVRWLKAGGSIYSLSKHLGHSSITTTERFYLGYLTVEEQEAVKRSQLIAFPGTVNVNLGAEASGAANDAPERKKMAQTVAHPPGKRLMGAGSY